MIFEFLFTGICTVAALLEGGQLLGYWYLLDNPSWYHVLGLYPLALLVVGFHAHVRRQYEKDDL